MSSEIKTSFVVKPEVGKRVLIQHGRKQKEVAALEVFFDTDFLDTPTVVVTPYWRGRSEVGHAETVTAVNQHRFIVESGNAASDYFVAWTAIGLAPDR